MFSAVKNFLKKGFKFLFLSFLAIVLVWIGYLYYLDQKHINFLPYGYEEMKDVHWNKDNFLLRAANNNWQFLRKEEVLKALKTFMYEKYSTEYALVTIDSSSDPKWYSKIYYPSGDKSGERHIVFWFSQQCEANKIYKTSAKFNNGEFRNFTCDESGKWLRHHYSAFDTGKYIDINIDGYQASYYLNLEDEISQKMLLEQKNVD